MNDTALSSSQDAKRPETALRVSVIVPHFNDLHNLAECLSALASQTLPARDYEVIVADNMSDCGLAEVEAVVAGRARVVLARERGAGCARNAAAAHARGAALAFIDSDCRPAPDWLAEGLGALEACDLVGGAMRVTTQSPPSPVESFEKVFAFDNESYVKRQGFSVSANLFTRRDVFEAVGGFLGEVSEDVEWCWRATRAGYRLSYAQTAVVSHPARRDWGELVKKWRRLTRETYKLSAQEGRGKVFWIARGLAVPFSVLPHGLKVLNSPKLTLPGERLAALKVLAEIRIWRLFEHLRVMFEKQKYST